MERETEADAKISALVHDEPRSKCGNPSAVPSEPSHAQAETPAPETSQETAAEVADCDTRKVELQSKNCQPQRRALNSHQPPKTGNQISARSRNPGIAGLPRRVTAPSVAPEGRTLEHEVLEDEEMEFHPVPDDLSALSEVAGDEELVLEEETLDADNGDSDRWIPKIADVDEDEVVAAEERGEQIYGSEHR